MLKKIMFVNNKSKNGKKFVAFFYYSGMGGTQGGSLEVFLKLGEFCKMEKVLQFMSMTENLYIVAIYDTCRDEKSAHFKE